MKARLVTATLFLAGNLAPPVSHAQGCAQCRDNTGATPPATQRAYAHAIELMTGAAATLLLATFVVIKRQP